MAEAPTMARKRFLAPEFFQHGELFDAEQETGLPLRLAFAGLWCQTDRRGIFLWKVRQLKLAIMPYDEGVDFAAVMTALQDHRFVRQYEVDGRQYGLIPSFDRWQSFHRDERQSDAPPPPERRDSSQSQPPTAAPARGQHGADTVLTTQQHGSKRPTTTTTTTTTSSTTDRAVNDLSDHTNVLFQQQECELRSAALPHEGAALDLLLEPLGKARYAAVGALHAIASELHVIRGKTSGRAAGAPDVMRAIAEMVGNGVAWNIGHFRGYVRRMVDRAPEPPTTEEREQARLARQIASVAQTSAAMGLEAPRTPEELEAGRGAREAAMAKFRSMARSNNPTAEAS